jgi:azurin
MNRALLLLLGAAALALPSHILAQAPSTQKPAAPATAKPAAGRLIEVEGNDQMKFNVSTITAKPGELITIRLKNVGKMPKAAMGHNLVLLKATAKADTFANEAMMAAATEYIPAARKGDIIEHTKLTGGGESAEFTIKAPAAGSYPYLCSFPGHFAAGMKGTLVVK